MMQTKQWIEEAARDELVLYLEGERGFACYETESTEDLRRCALLDLRCEEHETLKAAQHWREYGKKEQEKAAWDRERGYDLSAPGMSAADNRAKVSLRCAQSIEIEMETGVAHCSCHLIPMDECRARKLRGEKV